MHEDFDVIVVGAGTGMYAALAAHSAGLRVLLVEKSEYLGGSTAMSGGGIWAPGNRVLRAAGLADTKERVLGYLDEVVGDSAPRSRRVAFVDHTAPALDLLMDYTMLSWAHMRGYADYFSDLPGGSAIGRSIEADPVDATLLGPHRHLLRPTSFGAPVPLPITARDYKWLNLMTRKPKGLLTAVKRAGQGIGGSMLKREYVAGGQALAVGLIAAVIDKGIEYWTNTPLLELTTDNGRVTGVIVEHDGQRQEIGARRGVIIASGGFDHNLALRQRYQSEELENWSIANPANTGECLQLAEEVGAQLTNLDQAWWFPVVRPLPGQSAGPMLAERSLPGSIMVDKTGKRFMNEAQEYMSAGQIMLGLDGSESKLPVTMIFDQDYRNSYVFSGSVMPRQDLPAQWYDAGIAFKAETIDALAAATGLADLPATIHRFNLLASAGTDDDFGRGSTYYDRYYGDPTQEPNPNLRPLRNGPFYAVSIVPSDLGTCGGIAADEHARALRADGNPIPGLYAVGNAAANAFGNSYPGAGATIGQGIVFGYIAAQHMSAL